MGSTTSLHFDEFKMIKELLSPLSIGEVGAYGLSDDGAKIKVKNGDIILTTDAIIKGIHFPESEDPKTIASRIIRVNLSDIAAMGAVPRAYLLVLAIPSSTTLSWMESFVEGLSCEQKEFGISLIGGDTTRTQGELMLSITMIGETYDNKVLLRNGASVGDYIYVSGFIGDASLGLSLIEGRNKANSLSVTDYLINRFRKPTPRIDLGINLTGIANSAADVSDGLLADLKHICNASGVCAEIYLNHIPISSEAESMVSNNLNLRMDLLSGGDDYELIFTVPFKHISKVNELSEKYNVQIKQIGKIIGKGLNEDVITLKDVNGKILKISSEGYQHFRN